MTPRAALLRIAARAATQPDFDPIGIPDVDRMIDVLQHECPEFFVARAFENTRPVEQGRNAIPVRA